MKKIRFEAKKTGFTEFIGKTKHRRTSQSSL